MNYRHLVFIIVIFLVSGCFNSYKEDFCANSGYEINSPAYNLCLSRNQKISKELGYCNKHYNVNDENHPNLYKCLAEAKYMHNQYQEDYSMCDSDANNIYSEEAFYDELTEEELRSSCYYDELVEGWYKYITTCMEVKGWMGSFSSLWLYEKRSKLKKR